MAFENKEIIMKNFKTLSENTDAINLPSMWKQIKRLWPNKQSTLPCAKKNHVGQIISDPNELKNLYAKEYGEVRLRQRPVRSDLINTRKLNMKVFKLKLELAKNNKSAMWTMSDLDKLLSELKTHKARKKS